MSIELYQSVALRRDLPEHNLKKGDVATLIERVPHPRGGEDGYILEVFNAVGESLKIIAVLRLDVEVLRADEILTVRSLVESN